MNNLNRVPVRPRRRWLIWAGTTSLLACAAVSMAAMPEEKKNDAPVAQLGDVVVTQGQLQTILRQMEPPQRVQLLARRAALEDLLWQQLAGQLLARQARQAKWMEQPQVQAQIQLAVREAAERIIASTYLRQQAQVPEAYPSDAELAAAYAKQTPPPTVPARYEMAQIFLRRPGKDEEKTMDVLRVEAKALAARARKGSFAELARQHSRDLETAANGGQMPLLPLDRMRPIVAQAASALKVGEVSEPVETAQGLFIFKLLDKQAERLIPLEELAPALRQSMRASLAQRNERAYLERIAAHSDMHIDDAALAAAVERLP